MIIVQDDRLTSSVPYAHVLRGVFRKRSSFLPLSTSEYRAWPSRVLYAGAGLLRHVGAAEPRGPYHKLIVSFLRPFHGDESFIRRAPRRQSVTVFLQPPDSLLPFFFAVSHDSQTNKRSTMVCIQTKDSKHAKTRLASRMIKPIHYP